MKKKKKKKLKSLNKTTGVHVIRRTSAHRLVAPDGVEKGGVVPGADQRQDEGQVATVAVQLGVHEVLKVEQVGDDVHSW